jgi:hypothetical protein
MSSYLIAAASSPYSVITLEFEDTDANNSLMQQLRTCINKLAKDVSIYDTPCNILKHFKFVNHIKILMIIFSEYWRPHCEIRYPCKEQMNEVSLAGQKDIKKSSKISSTNV